MKFLGNSLVVLSVLVFLVVADKVSAAPITPASVSITDTVELQFLYVDDDVVATLSNTNIQDFVIATRGFSNYTTTHNVSSYLEVGENILNIELIDTGQGWTIGWNLLVNNTIVESFSCGIWNSLGCNNEEVILGVRYDQDIILNVVDPSAVPIPPALPLYLFGAAMLGFYSRKRVHRC